MGFPLFRPLPLTVRQAAAGVRLKSVAASRHKKALLPNKQASKFLTRQVSGLGRERMPDRTPSTEELQEFSQKMIQE